MKMSLSLKLVPCDGPPCILRVRSNWDLTAGADGNKLQTLENKLVGSCTRTSLLHLGDAGEESNTEALNSQAVSICTAPETDSAGAFRRALVAPQGK
jgi:hypothetical protein